MRLRTRILVSVVIGVVVTVAVAWGCATWGDVTPRRFDPNCDIELRVYESGSLSAYIYETGVSTAWIGGKPDINSGTLLGDEPPEWTSLRDRVEAISPAQLRHGPWVRCDAIGWPRAALMSTYSMLRWQDLQTGITPPLVGEWQPTSGVPLAGTARALPTRPLWPGFAIDTAFYAVIAYGMFFVSGHVRRTLRRRRGLCPACAYPVIEGTCPECGTAVTPRP